MLQPGLTDSEIARVESVFGFAFSAEHRALLAMALPVGPRWVDWRGGLAGGAMNCGAAWTGQPMASSSMC